MKQMDKTKNYNLSLPSKDDPVDIEVLDENFKTLDEKLHEVKEYAVTGPKTSTDGDIPLFSGTGGRTLKGSGRSFPLKTTDISDGAVTHDKIADKAIANNNIQLGAISGGQVKDKTLSPGKLEPSSTADRVLVTGSTSEGAKWDKVNISMIAPSGTQDRVMVTTKNGDKLEVHWSQIFNWMIAEGTIALDRMALGPELAECLAMYLKGQYMPVYHCKDSDNADMHNGWLANWCRSNGWYIGGLGPDCGGHPPYVNGNKTSWALCVIDGIKTEEGANGYNHRLQIAFDLVNSLVYMRRGWASDNTWAGSWSKVGGIAEGSIEEAMLAAALRERLNTLTSHLSNKSNPHGVTAAQVGLGNVDNTSDSSKPVSTTQMNFLFQEEKALAARLLGYNLVYANSTSNLHGVIKAVVTGGPTLKVASPAVRCQDEGVYTICNVSGSQITVEYVSGLISNPTYLSLKISNGAQAVIDIAVGGMSANYFVTVTGPDVFDPVTEFAKSKVWHWDSAYTHISNKSNPHGVTAAQVGLGNVNNTADINKPISNPQKQYIERCEAAFAAKLLGYTAISMGTSTDLSTVAANVERIYITEADASSIYLYGSDVQGTVQRVICNGTGKQLVIMVPHVVSDSVGMPVQQMEEMPIQSGEYADITLQRMSNPPLVTSLSRSTGTFDMVADLAKKLK